METPVFNFINRQQVYIEGVKNWYGQDFKRYLKLMRDIINDFLAKAGVKRLGDLRKASFGALLRRIDKRLNEVLSGYGTEFLAELQKFTRIDLTMRRSVWATLKPEKDISGVKLSSTWSAVKDRIVPAFGKTTKQQLTEMITLAKDKVRVRLNTGFADNESVADAGEAVTNLDPKGEPSTLKGIGAAARSLMATAIQHASNTASEFVSSLVYDCYQWCSVIDSKTSPVCRERNGKVYTYGEGPMPPAHPHCRSNAVPCPCGEGLGSVPTFFSWVSAQSTAFLADAFGASVAKKVNANKLKAADLPDIAAHPALSVDEYELKTPLLTA